MLSHHVRNSLRDVIAHFYDKELEDFEESDRLGDLPASPFLSREIMRGMLTNG